MQTLHFLGQCRILLLDNLDFAYESLELALRTPHGEQTTIAPDGERHHGEQKETTPHKCQRQPGCSQNLAHQTWLRQLGGRRLVRPSRDVLGHGLFPQCRHSVKGRETGVSSTRAKRALARDAPSPTTYVLFPIGLMHAPQVLVAPRPQPAAWSRCPHPYGLSRQSRSRTVTARGKYRPAT